MKAGWERKKIGDVCMIKPPKKEARMKIKQDDFVSFLPMEDLSSGKMIASPVKKRKFSEVIGSYTYFSEDDVLLAKITPCFENGKLGIARLLLNETGFGSSEYIVLRACKNIIPEFLYYFLSQDTFRKEGAERMAGAVGHKRLPVEFVNEYLIPVPPLPDQRRIVAILDEAFAGIADAKENAEQNLKNTKEVFASYLESVFNQRGEGWTIKRVSEIADHSLGKMLDKMKNKGINKPYLRNINVRWFEFNLSDLLEMPFLENESERYTVRKGDVLVCEGGYPGRAAIWEEDYQIYFQKALHRVRFHKKGHNKWFIYYLAIQNNNGKLKDHFSGTGIQHFTGQSLSKLTVPIPPEVELYKYLSKFDNLSEETKYLESIYQQKLSNLEELKKSLLQQAFSGAL